MKCPYLIRRVLAVLLVLTTLLPVGVSAAVPETVLPQASSYLDSYSASIEQIGNGRMKIKFTVQGVDTMDSVGVLSIELYESKNGTTWSCVRSYSSSDFSVMMGYNTVRHEGYLHYQGIGGRYYKAYVCVWAGNGTSGDSRYFWTSTIQAI